MAVNISLLNSTNANNINTNFERVATALADTVGRSGSTPNQMNADLDMNFNDLLNVKRLDGQEIYLDGVPIVSAIDMDAVVALGPNLAIVSGISEEIDALGDVADDVVVASENIDAIIAAPANAAAAQLSADAAALSAGAAGKIGDIYGLTLSNNSGDTDNDIDIGAGYCRDDISTANIELVAGITKYLDFAWSTGFGGLDTGVKAANKWYHVFMIKNTSTDAVNAIFSLSPTNPLMPSGYDVKRRIGTVGTDGSGNIRQFVQTGNYFGLSTPFSVAAADPNDGNVLRALDVPLGSKLRLGLTAYYTCSAAPAFFACKDPDEGVATTSDFQGYSGAAGQNAIALANIFCNPSGQIYTYSNRSETVLTNLYLKGWTDSRGTTYEDF